MKEDSIHLSESAKAHIQVQLGMGNYSDASEYIESLIREDQLTREQLGGVLRDRRDELEQLAVEGLNSGEPIRVDSEYWANKRKNLSDEV